MFLRHSRDGDFQVGPAESLWKLLSEIARSKIRQRVALTPLSDAACGASSRSWNRRIPPFSAHQKPAIQPSAEEILALVEDSTATLDAFDPRNRDVLRLCFDGYSTPEIAELLNCSRWSIRRALDQMGRALRENSPAAATRGQS